MKNIMKKLAIVAIILNIIPLIFMFPRIESINAGSLGFFTPLSYLLYGLFFLIFPMISFFIFNKIKKQKKYFILSGIFIAFFILFILRCYFIIAGGFETIITIYGMIPAMVLGGIIGWIVSLFKKKN